MDAFIGTIIMFGGNFAPRGWQFCNGQLLAISQNSALFSILGTTYGGDGRTTFALPDLRGSVPVHAGTRPGGSTFKLGQRGGSELTQLSINNVPSHNHTLVASSNAADQKAPGGNYLPTNGRTGAEIYADAIGTPSDMGKSIGSTGGGQPFNNMQPYRVVNYIIAVQGTYPSRS